MSSLTFAEKRQLEELFEMGGGYVLDFSDRTFQEFFFDVIGLDIYGGGYEDNGGSKAKHLRCFWEKESDANTGKLLKAMVEYAVDLADEKDQCRWGNETTTPIRETVAYKKSWQAVQRLLGTTIRPVGEEISEEDFLKQTFTNINFDILPVESSLITVIKSRVDEAERSYKAGANLACVIMCGSILEAVLLGLCQAKPKQFNTAKSSPKANGTSKPFNAWKLAEFISVSYEVGALKEDVRKFSDTLRDFRNYIHPYEQLATGFSPDHRTAEICLTVLKAAISQITEWGAKK